MLKTILKAGLILSLLLIGTISASAKRSYEAQGKASYYANKFHGRRTSSGEFFNQDSLTCAHRTLPFGTYLKVKNQKNGKEVIVRVNDRGPFVKGRVVDLSRAAAEQIGMLQSGVATVEVVQVEKPVFPEMPPFEVPLFQMYDVLLDKSYTLEEWRNSHAKDHMTLLEKAVVDSLRSHIADIMEEQRK
jgi:rare lipoprotein A